MSPENAIPVPETINHIWLTLIKLPDIFILTDPDFNIIRNSDNHLQGNSICDILSIERNTLAAFAQKSTPEGSHNPHFQLLPLPDGFNQQFYLFKIQPAYKITSRFSWEISTNKNFTDTQFEILTGYSPEEVAQTPGFLAQNCVTLDEYPIIDLINQQTPNKSFSFCIQKKDGTPIWLEVRMVKTNDNVILTLNENQLVDEMSQRMVNLKEEKSQILDSMTDGAALIGLDLKIKYANKTFRSMFNVENPQGQPCHKIINNLPHRCMNCSLQRVIHSRTTYQNTRTEKNGPVVLSTTFPVFDTKSQINAAVITFRDITEKKMMEKALKMEATVNKTIADISKSFLMPDLPEEKIAQQVLKIAMGFTKSTIGYVASMNPLNDEMTWKAYENFSLKDPNLVDGCQKECRHKNCLFDHVRNSKEPLVLTTTNEYLLNQKLYPCHLAKKNTLVVPALFNDKLLGQIFVSGCDTPYTKADNNLLTQLSSIFAISIFRLHMEHQLIEAKEAAEESNRLKTAFLANMSHEIRTPMNSINGFSELLRNSDQPADEQKRFIEIIYKSSNQLLSIINNILDISKLEVGQMKINNRKVNINQIITDAIESFEAELNDRKSIMIQSRFAFDHQNAMITCDSSRLLQVITNLLNNALKFTEKGIIEVGYELIPSNEIQFYVKDPGIGIPKDKYEIIFNRFSQVEEGMTRNYGGTGLGLTISKGLVELMNGRIWLNSEPGVGSVFYFTVPFITDKQLHAADSIHKNKSDAYNWKGKTILLVEDEVNSQNFMQTIILPFGPKIIYAMDGFDAVHKALTIPEIDIILMDIRLPRLDGLEATRKIRQSGNNKPIIAQTANAMPEDNDNCMQAGCNDFFPKPVNRVDFLKTINYYLGNPVN